MTEIPLETSEAHYVVFKLGSYFFGLEATEIRDVFRPQHVTPVPLARREVLGVLNMRSRIVTAIDVKHILAIEEPPEEAEKQRIIVLNRGEESYALMVDKVIETRTVPTSSREEAPQSIPSAWHRCCRGLHKLDIGMMVILDIDRLMSFVDEPVEE